MVSIFSRLVDAEEEEDVVGCHLCQLGASVPWSGVGKEYGASPLFWCLSSSLRSFFVSQVDAILRLNAAFIQKYGFDLLPIPECCHLDVSMCCHLGCLAGKITSCFSTYLVLFCFSTPNQSF